MKRRSPTKTTQKSFRSSQAIRQENLIAAAKKNVTRFAKLSRMQGGEAATEHNEKRRASFTLKQIDQVKATIEKQGSTAGIGSSVIKSLVSGIETSMREKPLDEIRAKKEERSHDDERSRRRMGNPSYAKIHIDDIPLPDGVVGVGAGETKIVEEEGGEGGEGEGGAGRG